MKHIVIFFTLYWATALASRGTWPWEAARFYMQYLLECDAWGVGNTYIARKCGDGKTICTATEFFRHIQSTNTGRNTAQGYTVWDGQLDKSTYMNPNTLAADLKATGYDTTGYDMSKLFPGGSRDQAGEGADKFKGEAIPQPANHMGLTTASAKALEETRTRLVKDGQPANCNTNDKLKKVRLAMENSKAARQKENENKICQDFKEGLVRALRENDFPARFIDEANELQPLLDREGDRPAPLDTRRKIDTQAVSELLRRYLDQGVKGTTPAQRLQRFSAVKTFINGHTADFNRRDALGHLGIIRQLDVGIAQVQVVRECPAAAAADGWNMVPVRKK